MRILYVLMLISLCSCTADIHQLVIKDSPSALPEPQGNKIYVGEFLDMRQGTGGDTTYIGTIRGGYGNPLCRVRAYRGVGDLVHKEIIKIARYKGINAVELPDTFEIYNERGYWIINRSDETDNTPILLGDIMALNVTNNAWSSEDPLVVINIKLILIDPTSGRSIWRGPIDGRDRAPCDGWCSSKYANGFLNTIKNLIYYYGDSILNDIGSKIESEGSDINRIQR